MLAKTWRKLIAVPLALSLMLGSVTAAFAVDGTSPGDDLDDPDNYGLEDIPHSHSWGSGVIVKAATCTEAGSMRYTCSCGETKTEEISAPGHQWDAGVETTAATCTVAGAKLYTCTVCGITETREIPAAGHDWDDNYTCRTCGTVQPVVATIGDTEYRTLDKAVSEAADGDIVEILADCETQNGFGLAGTALTIDGNGHAISAPNKGIYLAKGKDSIASLTFKNCKLELAPINGTPTVSGEGYAWAVAVVNYDCELSFIDSDVTFMPTVTSAIYYHLGSKFNLDNSRVVIDGFKGSAFQTDDQQNGGVYTTELNLKNGSKLTATKCYAGITSTIQVTVEDSELVNCDHRGNGSNGADYIFKNATADISGNGAHGMSARNITAEDSTLTCSNNGMTGIIFTGTADFKNSDVTITGTKGKSYWNAGMRLMKANARGTVDQDTKLTITGNYVSGVFLDSSSKLTIADGADVLISGNLAEQANCSKEKELARKGGGIVVRADASAALPASAKIYNNHAAIAGDDIYVEDGGTISFGEVGADWYLDGTPDHCKDQIDGWYHDGHFVNEAGETLTDRWEAHASEQAANFIQEFTAFDENHMATVTGVSALKAAHAYIEPPVIVVPDDDDDDDDDKPVVVIPEDPTPLEPVPVEPETPVEPPVEIPEEDVPLVDVPETGDTTLLWVLGALLSGSGLLLLGLFGKKRKETGLR